ncbi:hypothetical protein BD779DRAFT_895569 [Infundibulicybe gibba]|nr:hypothetical protein BD779DRAFT_895569 [Infundibulicybe gibba]
MLHKGIPRRDKVAQKTNKVIPVGFQCFFLEPLSYQGIISSILMCVRAASSILLIAVHFIIRSSHREKGGFRQMHLFEGIVWCCSYHFCLFCCRGNSCPELSICSIFPSDVTASCRRGQPPPHRIQLKICRIRASEVSILDYYLGSLYRKAQLLVSCLPKNDHRYHTRNLF